MGKVSDSRQKGFSQQVPSGERDISLGLLLYTHDFYTLHLPHDKFSVLSNHAQEMTGLSESTYICEQFFSQMNIVKN
jgi:hypothetical protein